MISMNHKLVSIGKKKNIKKCHIFYQMLKGKNIQLLII